MWHMQAVVIFFMEESQRFTHLLPAQQQNHMCVWEHVSQLSDSKPFNSVPSDATSWQQIYIHKYVITLCSKSKKKGNQRKSIKTYFKFWDGKWWILIWVTSYELPFVLLCVLPLFLLFFYMLWAHAFIYLSFPQTFFVSFLLYFLHVFSLLMCPFFFPVWIIHYFLCCFFYSFLLSYILYSS